MAELVATPGEDPTDLCPNSLPELSASLDSLSTDDLSPKIIPCRFFLEGRCHFGARCRNQHPGDAGDTCNLEDPGPVHDPSLQLTPGKKPPMKTAEDVISRLLWDTQLSAEQFSIGYLDRFLGILEESFTAFSWEDLASVGPGVLAIPKHRIQYFKYRDRVVWDKVSRIDDIFGSTGSGKTILEVITEEIQATKENFPNGLQNQQEEVGDNSTTEKQLNRIPSRQELAKDSGESFMDNLELLEDTFINQNGNMVSKEKKKEGVNSTENECFLSEGGGKMANEPAENKVLARRKGRCFSYSKQRPTHFIAIPITSPAIQEAVKHFQEALCAVSSDFTQFCVPVATLHVTLCLLHLDTPEEIHKTIVALQELQTNFQRLLPPALLLSFSKLETFNSRVLYLAPVSMPELGVLAQTLEDAFIKKGLTVIPPPAKEKFHLTVVKIPLKATRLQLPSDSAWAPTVEDLGAQAVEAICLYEVGRSSRTDNLYVSILKLDLYGGS